VCQVERNLPCAKWTLPNAVCVVIKIREQTALYLIYNDILIFVVGNISAATARVPVSRTLHHVCSDDDGRLHYTVSPR
jgi:hypothetical protein